MNMATTNVGLPTRIWLRTSIMSEPKLLMEWHNKDIANIIRSNPEYNKLLVDVLRVREIDPNYMVSSIYVDTTTSENPIPFVNCVNDVARTGYLEELNELLKLQMVIYRTLEEDSAKIERAVKKLIKRIHKIGDFSIQFIDLVNRDCKKIYQTGTTSTFDEILCMLDDVHAKVINTLDKEGNPDLITTCMTSFSSKFVENGTFLFATLIRQVASRLEKYNKISAEQVMIPVPGGGIGKLKHIHELAENRNDNHGENMDKTMKLWRRLWNTIEAYNDAMHAFDITCKVPKYFYI